MPPQKQLAWILENVTGRDSWLAAANRLSTITTDLSFQWGFWWLYGEERQFGDMRALTQSSHWKLMGGPTYQTLANASSVCRAFPPHRVRASFSHHALLTSMDEATQEMWLDWIEDKRSSVEATRSEIERRKLTQAVAGTENALLPEVVADVKRRGRAPKSLVEKLHDRARKNYETDMSEVEIIRDSKAGITPTNLRDMAKEFKRVGEGYVAAAQDLWSREDESRFRRAESSRNGD